jgi:hypothetical protein
MMKAQKENLHMLQKTADRIARKDRPTWVGYYSRLTPTKIEKQRKLARKHKKYDFD